MSSMNRKKAKSAEKGTRNHSLVIVEGYKIDVGRRCHH
jgi:hypothetical protein